MSTLIEKLSAFFDAFQTIIGISEIHLRNMVERQRSNLLNAMNLLKEIKEKRGLIHIAGMGRSKLAAMIIGELLKNLGYQVSVIGDFLSKPVREGDIVLAVSSSGWTTTTCLIVEEAVKRGARIIALTATPGSKLDRLADVSLYLPGKPIIDDTSYIIRQILGRHKTPLTPMGTIPETNAILVGMGIIGMLGNGEKPVEMFKNTISTVLENAKESFKKILNRIMELEKTIEILSMSMSPDGPKVYLIGTGIGKIVSLMGAMRFQHLGLNVASIDDWKFRNENDTLIAISSSGESAITLLYAEEAKRTGMKLIALSANPESTLIRISDLKLLLSDISERKEYVQFRVFDDVPSRFIPAFEYAALITLESIVAQIAENFLIKEEDMRRMHANIE